MIDGAISTFSGTQVFQSLQAVERVARFPDKKWTKRRRRRVIGKFGSWFIEKPAAFRCGPAIYCHPKIYAELKARTAAT